MSVEIERKFLVVNDAWRDTAHAAQHLRQGYLNNETRCSEFEYEIPISDAHKMLDTLCRKPLIEKVRYHVDAGRHTWEIDVFEGDNAGLMVAEIELDHPVEAFERPSWLGEEVTHDVRYYNTSLSRHPYKDW